MQADYDVYVYKLTNSNNRSTPERSEPRHKLTAIYPADGFITASHIAKISIPNAG